MIGKVLARPNAGLVVLGAALLIVTILAAHGVTTDWAWAWHSVSVSADLPPFKDFRSITNAWPCVRNGTDVYLTGVCDPMGRPFNYPPAWLAASPLGLGDGATIPAALAMACAALAVLIRFVAGRRVILGLVVALTLSSPSVLLGFERGNTDLMIFGLLGVASLCSAGTPARQALGAAAVLVATVLKLFPVAAVLSLSGGRRWGWLMAATGAASLLYGIAIIRYLTLIHANTPTEGGESYGAVAIFGLPAGAWLVSKIGIGERVVLLLAGCVAAAAAILAEIARRRYPWLCRLTPGAPGTGFQIGAAVYCLSFLAGSSYAYRLIMLLLLLPQIEDWIEHETGAGRSIGIGLLLSSEAVCWLCTGSAAAETIAQGFAWLLFAGLAFILPLTVLRTLPRYRQPV